MDLEQTGAPLLLGAGIVVFGVLTVFVIGAAITSAALYGKLRNATLRSAADQSRFNYAVLVTVLAMLGLTVLIAAGALSLDNKPVVVNVPESPPPNILVSLIPQPGETTFERRTFHMGVAFDEAQWCNGSFKEANSQDLSRIASELNDLRAAGQLAAIVVVGSADYRKVRSTLGTNVDDNYDLAAKRATCLTKLLRERMGIDDQDLFHSVPVTRKCPGDSGCEAPDRDRRPHVVAILESQVQP